MSLALLQNLWCQIVRRAAHGRSPTNFHFLLRDHECCQTKIADLDVHVAVQEEVSGLEIPVDNVSVVEVFDGSADLDNQSSNFRQSQVLPSLEHIGQ